MGAEERLRLLAGCEPEGSDSTHSLHPLTHPPPTHPFTAHSPTHRQVRSIFSCIEEILGCTSPGSTQCSLWKLAPSSFVCTAGPAQATRRLYASSLGAALWTRHKPEEQLGGREETQPGRPHEPCERYCMGLHGAACRQHRAGRGPPVRGRASRRTSRGLYLHRTLPQAVRGLYFTTTPWPSS